MSSALLVTAGGLVSTTGVLAGASTACGCEGGAEPQKITVKPIAWSGGGACPEKEGKVHFAVVKQWCEYEVKNENAVENVTIEGIVLKFKVACEFGEGVWCLETKKPAKAECKENAVLAVGTECYIRLEYIRKPAAKSETGLLVETKSAPGNAVAKPEVKQTVE